MVGDDFKLAFDGLEELHSQSQTLFLVSTISVLDIGRRLRVEEQRASSPFSPDLHENLLPRNPVCSVVLHLVKAAIQLCLLSLSKPDQL